MNKLSFLSFRNSKNNRRTSVLRHRPVPKINFLILETLHSGKNLLRRSTQTKQIAPIAAHLYSARKKFEVAARSERGDVPGWVLVVLMTTGLVTGIWTVAQPRLSSILKNSLDNMNSIR
jgi:hypothetical protein